MGRMRALRSDHKSYWLTDGAVLAAALSVTTVGRLLNRRVVEPRCFPCDDGTINALDRWTPHWHSRSLEVLSYVAEIAALATPVVNSVRVDGLSRTLWADLLICGEVVSLNAAANIVVKTLVARPVPRVYTPLFPELQRESRGYGSFYSGHCAHTTGALAANAVLGHLRGDRHIWPWTALSLGTAIVSITRVGAGRHFFTDALAGSLVGATIGSLVPWLRQRGRSRPGGRAAAAELYFIGHRVLERMVT